MKIVILVVPDSTVVSAAGRVSTVVQVDCSPSIRQVELHLKSACVRAAVAYERYLATAPN